MAAALQQGLQPIAAGGNRSHVAARKQVHGLAACVGGGSGSVALPHSFSAVSRIGGAGARQLRASSAGSREGIRAARSSPMCAVEGVKLTAEEKEAAKQKELEDRILSGDYGGGGGFFPTMKEFTDPVRKACADAGPAGRAVAKGIAEFARKWDTASRADMPTATGDIREIVGQPVFVPLYTLFRAYGPVFRLSFGPKTFVVVSDNKVAKHILLTNANNYSKGLLSEILDFVMGQGLIPADGEVWKARRKMIVPALHKKYVARMVDMFGGSAEFGSSRLALAAEQGTPIEMENFFSRLALDIIGKAVFNYEFDSLTTDDPVIKAVYTVLRESEYRSVTIVPYWNTPLKWIVPRQRRCIESLKVINDTLNVLVADCKKMVDDDGLEFGEEFLNENDPSYGDNPAPKARISTGVSAILSDVKTACPQLPRPPCAPPEPPPPSPASCTSSSRRGTR
mmetsp:Transcript_57565/g.182302  ORF Transcript_57565/g.182302 Transcript_57565/m.182302 type:complete len:453 (-) Transcript_57565:662-2020(-)